MLEICGDLEAEGDALEGLLSGVPADDFDRLTPAPGWAVRDQVSHLWFFDQRALLALTDPEAFTAEAEAMIAGLKESGGTDFSVVAGRDLTPGALLTAWRADRLRLLDVARSVDPSTRVPWYGPAMGARSFITARLMETWAHGQDIVDALGLTRTSTNRLRHVAHIGVRARPFSYVANGMDLPESDVRVELRAPEGAETDDDQWWAWGSDDAADLVRGDALDFCLVVTRRRHPADVTLEVTGDAAAEWIAIAQAFAGPAGSGRQPGQFS